MKYLLLLSLIGCSIKGNVSGDVTVHHRIDINMDQLKQYCDSKFPDSETLARECLAEEAKRMIDFIEGLGSK